MTRVLVWLVGTLCALQFMLVPLAAASAEKPTLQEMESIVMCPSCGTTIDRSNSPAADRMRSYVSQRIADGWTRDEIIAGVIDEYGGDGSVIAATPATTSGRAVWFAPLVLAGLVIACGVISLRRWKRS